MIHDTAAAANVGRSVDFGGHAWTITGVNYLGNYDIERTESREDGDYKVRTSCVLGLPPEHPHYASIRQP